MAIDTAAKRRNVSGIAGVPLIPGVTPDASQDEAWRQESGWGYSGIPVEPPVVIGDTVPAVWLAVPTNRHYVAQPGNRTWLDTGEN